jgi:hypothetical protein
MKDVKKAFQEYEKEKGVVAANKLRTDAAVGAADAETERMARQLAKKVPRLGLKGALEVLAAVGRLMVEKDA